MNGGQQGGGNLIQPGWEDFWLEMMELSPQEQEIARKRSMVENLRGAASQAPQMRGNGRIMVASNPLEHVANVAGQGLASWRERQADTAAAGLKKDRMGVYGKQKGRIADARKALVPTAGEAGGLQQLAGPGVDEYDPAYGYASPL